MAEYDNIKNWHKGIKLEELAGHLKKRDFNVQILGTVKEINDYLLNTIPANAKVGLGGSITIRELGVDKLLKERGNTVLDHWDKSLSPEQSLNVRKEQLTSDYFLTSANAITTDGRIINIDGVGNRVAAMIFGPKHVISIISANKIARDTDDAIWRAKNNASSMNTKRGNMETPCAKTGRCGDCIPPKTICRVTTIIEYKPMQTDFTVILTPLELGF
jgi:hypothetical protein